MGKLRAQRWRAEGELVASLIEPSQDAGATGSADRRRGKSAAEPHAAGSETIEVRCLDDGITRTPHQIVALVVGEQEKDVGARMRGGHGDLRRRTRVQRGRARCKASTVRRAGVAC